jgi:methyl-accepting chemotaxis protein
MYRKIAVMLLLGKTLLNSVNDTVNTVEESIKTASRNINDTITEVKDSITEVKDGIMKVSKSFSDTVTGIQERMKPLLPVLAVIQGISEGIKSIREIFKKETYEGGKVNE